MAKKKMRFAYLTDHSIDEIIDSHIEFVTTTLELDENCFVKIVETGAPPPRKAILIPKYQFLIHVIIMRCRAGNGYCRLDYSFFTKLLGKSYRVMLHHLHYMRIINLSNDYEIGKKSREIQLIDWNIAFIDNIDNIIIRDYLSKWEKDKKKKRKEREKLIIKTIGKDFTTSYNERLSRLDLIRRDEALKYLHSRTYKSPNQEHFFSSVIENFYKKDLKIISFDRRGRIYHYLTNCPRVLRKFFNLKYDVDIANSQPLLFSNFLIKHYHIDFSIIDFISKIENNSIFNININGISGRNVFNVGKQLRKLLKNSGLERTKIKNIPSDVLAYIYSCMKGLFWDDFVTTFAELERGEVKECLFREVFYSHSRTMRYKQYGKVFAKIYPSVWHVIREMKKDAEQLCDKITKVESELFHSILEKCFEKGWIVTSIHDAIVVLDVPENEGIDEGELIDVILTEYREHGLIPTVHLEGF